MTCQHCDAKTTNGLALCDRCQYTLARACENIRSYHADLFTIAPPPSGVRRRGEETDPTGSAVLRLNASDPAEDLADRARNALSTWVRCLLEDRPQLRAPANTVEAMARLLAGRSATIATLPYAGEIARELTRLEWDMRRFIEANKQRWYAGVCGHIEDPDAPEAYCTRVLYADPEADFVRCPVCRTTWPVKARRAVLLEEARNVETNVATIARALATLLDDQPSVATLQARIQKWCDRGVIDRRGHLDFDGRVRKTYRLGDVLDTLLSGGPRRSA